MEKLDLTKRYKNYYSAKLKPELVNFGQIPYLTITGKGEPAGKEFSTKTGALFPVAYGIKKLYKHNNMDFCVPKLEGLWWVESSKPAISIPRSEWLWKLLIRMPDFATSEMLEKAVKEVIEKKKIDIANQVKLEIIDERNLVSILHVGSYATEPESLKQMDDFITKSEYVKDGHHHEIYLSDPNKTHPDKLKTILRQPVK